MKKQTIYKELAKIAFPASIGLFFNTMFNFVDTYFAAQSSTQSLAAISLSFPLFLGIIAISEGLSTAASALISYHHGQNNQAEARKVGAQILVYGLFTTGILMFCGLKFSPNAFILLGASDTYLAQAREYMDTIFLGSFLFVFTSAINGILIARGDAKPLRNSLIAGFFLNCLLDPWFLYGGLGLPPMGLKGIALATLVTKALGLIYLGFILWFRYHLVEKHPRHYLPRLAEMKRIFSQQLPASLNILTIALGLFVTSYYLRPFGKEAIAAYGASLRIEQIALLPTIGIQIAAVSIVGHSFGAKRFTHMKQALLASLGTSIVIMTIGAVAMYTIPSLLLGVFTNEEQVIAIGSRYLRIASLISWAYPLGGVCVAALQGIHQPGFTIAIGVFRQLIGRIFFIELFFWLLTPHIESIWWGIFAVNWTASLLLVLYTTAKLYQFR